MHHLRFMTRLNAIWIQSKLNSVRATQAVIAITNGTTYNK